MVYWPEGVAQSEFPEHHVACYRADDGKLLWDTQVPPGPWLLKDLRGGYSAPTPCTDGERVYVLFGSSVLAALDFDGKIVWRKEDRALRLGRGHRHQPGAVSATRCSCWPTARNRRSRG